MFVSFAIFDDSGDPVTGLAPGFLVFKDGLGVDRTKPAIVEMGSGKYGFTTTTADDMANSIYVVSASFGSITKYVPGFVRNAIAFGLFDGGGTPLVGQSPTFLNYDDPTGAPLSPPTITDMGNGLYSFIPPDAHISSSAGFLVSSNGSGLPPYYDGTISSGSTGGQDGTPPTVSNFSPSVGSNVSMFETITFDVLDNQSLFRRIILVADYSTVVPDEVIHDGNSFGPNYSNGSNVRSAIAGGYRYTILRDDGWPGNITITPFAIDTSGNENA